MKTFTNHQIGIDGGEAVLFSDFEDDGPMWTGTGSRLARHAVTFARAFAEAPSVTVHLAMLDMSNEAYVRADLKAENITSEGFDIVFRTWGDTRVARVRAAWQAIGPLPLEDTWDL